ncbi:MAG: RNA polymerase sigma factor [Ferruginibacter sp.]
MNQPDIIERLKNGDRNVFSEIVEACKDMVFNTTLGIVQNEEDAEDITQEVFIQVYESINQFRGDAKLSTWIYRITISKALDFEKKKRRQKNGGLLKRIFNEKSEDEPAHFNHPGIVLDEKENAVVLFKALNKLPEKQRIAFILHKLEAQSYQEIAAVMKISLMAVESLQVRAKNNLRNILKEYYEQHFK